MKVVMCHNYFRERGGEDQVYEDEVGLLRSGGHEVIEFVRHNSDMSGFSVAGTAVAAPWNAFVYRELRDLVARESADIVHVHNTLPQLSPSVFRAGHRGGAAVVHTLHNYRWACPKGILFRDGNPCEACLGKTMPWPSIRHACYRDSRVATGVVATTLALHNALGTPSSADAYIAAGSFIRDKMSEAGLPEGRIHVRPNFLDPDPGPGEGGGGFAMYLGRLSPEKRIDTLLDAWEMLETDIRLVISGDGPLRPLVEAAAARNSNIEYLGFAPRSDVDRLLGEAELLVFTSGTYEAQPLTILETFARGTPVVAGRIGAMQGMIEDGTTGWLFEPGDAADLAGIVEEAFKDRERLVNMRRFVREEFARNYSIEGKLDRLIDIYDAAIDHHAMTMGRKR